MKNCFVLHNLLTLLLPVITSLEDYIIISLVLSWYQEKRLNMIWFRILHQNLENLISIASINLLIKEMKFLKSLKVMLMINYFYRHTLFSCCCFCFCCFFIYNIYAFTKLSARTGCNTRPIFKRSLTSLNLGGIFFHDWLPKSGWRTQSTLIFTNSWRENNWIHTFSKRISAIWNAVNHVLDSKSYCRVRFVW